MKLQKGDEAVDEGPAKSAAQAPDGSKLGRNDPCWCGSGKKFKRCHGADR
jgi:preprotein translocase subunit SecA